MCLVVLCLLSAFKKFSSRLFPKNSVLLERAKILVTTRGKGYSF